MELQGDPAAVAMAKAKKQLERIDMTDRIRKVVMQRIAKHELDFTHIVRA